MNDRNDKFIKWYFTALVCLIYSSAYAQLDTTIALQNLEPIYVKATKIQKSWLPAANSVYTLSTENKDQLVQNSLQEFLVKSPSVFGLNSFNKAQDLRLSIRGFGSRAAFGVRGVKIIVDGIPETTTDGQGQLDNINLGIIERIEILNNGSSSIYGNASGGVVNILTTDESAFDDKNHFLNLGLGLYAFGGQQYQLTTGKKINKTSLLFHANHHQADAYREHSDFQSTNFNFRVIQELKTSGKVELILNYMNSPVANDPGGVELNLFDSIPRSARDRNVLYDAGEAIDQFKSSLRYTSNLGKHLKLNTYGFYSNRNFSGRLPFTFGGRIDLQRNFFGHGSSVSLNLKKNKLRWISLLGYELSGQRDARDRFENLEGVKGALTLSQDEHFSNLGIYNINDFRFDKFTFNIAFRYDINQIRVKDDFLENGNGSGSIDLNDFNYSLGLAYQVSGSKNLFANLSTSFETPTLNELSNNPDGSGFNPNLRPQFARHFELGLKGFFYQSSSFQVSLFQVKTSDELLPFELEEFPGRTFFRNVGSTDRLGLEFFVNHPFNDFFSATTNWTFNQFTFGEYEIDGESFKDNLLPGLPNIHGFVQLELKFLKNFKVIYQNQIIGKIFMNDANTVFQEPKSISNLSLKYSWNKDKFRLLPYLGVNNVLQAKYADNIRINAFGGRYFEAAPSSMVFGGLNVRF